VRTQLVGGPPPSFGGRGEEVDLDQVGEREERLGLGAEDFRRLTEAVVDLAKSKDRASAELFFDDIELLAKGPVHPEAASDFEDETTDLDELLEDELERMLDSTLEALQPGRT